MSIPIFKIAFIATVAGVFSNIPPKIVQLSPQKNTFAMVNKPKATQVNTGRAFCTFFDMNVSYKNTNKNTTSSPISCGILKN
jgi:hypothetical protein